FDGGQVRQLRWAVDVECFAVLQRQLIDHGRCGSDQVQVVFALETLLDDLHMQHAEEADAEAEAKGIGAFRLVLQRSIVEGQLLQCIAEIFEVIRADREQAGIDLWLDPLEARQHFDIWGSGQGQGVAYRRPVNVLDTSDDEAHLAGLEVGGTGVLRVEHAYAVDLMRLASGFHQHLVAFLDPPVADPYQRDDAQIVVEPGVDDQRLQRCIDLASGRRNRGYQALQNIVYAHAALGAAGYGIGGIDPDEVLDFGLDLVRVGLGQIHLVRPRHAVQALRDGCVAVGNRLRLDALSGIHHQERAFTGGQRTAYLVGEIHVAGGIDEIELISLTVACRVMKGHAVGFDGDAALALKVHGVEDLRSHFTLCQATTHLDKAVGQGRLAMINVRDDGKIADMTQVTHS